MGVVGGGWGVGVVGVGGGGGGGGVVVVVGGGGGGGGGGTKVRTPTGEQFVNMTRQTAVTDAISLGQPSVPVGIPRERVDHGSPRDNPW